MLPAPTKRQTIVSKDLIRKYDEEMETVALSYDRATESISDYWMALWRIKAGNLWRAKFEENGFLDWLEDVIREPFGPSKSDFYATMGAIERLKRIGLTEDEIHSKLGKLGTALKGDLAKLFSNNGKGDLLPEVASQIESGGETPIEFIERISELGPGEARHEVNRLVNKDSVFFVDDPVYDEHLGRLMVNVRWENEDDGLIYKGTLLITSSEVTSPKRHTKKPNFLPEIVADYILSRFGLSR